MKRGRVIAYSAETRVFARAPDLFIALQSQRKMKWDREIIEPVMILDPLDSLHPTIGETHTGINGRKTSGPRTFQQTR